MILGANKEEIQFISRQITADFQRRHDAESLRQLFFEQQNQNCILCGQPLQGFDGACSQIEHMIPKRIYAEYYVAGWPVEKVLENANDLANRRLSHIECGVRKSDYFLDELPDDFFAQVEPLAEKEIQKRKERFSERSRKGGLIGGAKGGRATNETTNGRKGNGGRKTCALHPEIHGMGGLAGGRKGGLIAGRIAVESGHLAIIRTPEHQAAAGRIAGRIAVESGHLAAISKFASHTYWHTNRNIVKPGCKFCEAAKG